MEAPAILTSPRCLGITELWVYRLFCTKESSCRSTSNSFKYRELWACLSLCRSVSCHLELNILRIKGKAQEQRQLTS